MKKKGGALKVFIFLLLILAIVAGAAYYLYAKTDMLLTPTQKFQKYLIKNVEAIQSFNNEPYTTFYDKAKGKIIEQTETAKYKIDFSEEVEGLVAEPEIALTTKSDLENTKFDMNLKINTNYDKDELVELAESLDLDDTFNGTSIDEMNFDIPFLDISFLLNSDSVALYYPELYEKQFVVENKGIKQFIANMAGDESVAENIPDKIHILEDIQTKETQDRLKKLSKSYYEKFVSKFPDSCYTEEKNVTIVVDGKEYKTNKYTFTVSDYELGKAVFEMYDDILQDEELRDILSHDFDSLLDKVYESYKEVTYEDIYTEDEDSYKDVVYNIYEYKQATLKNEIIYDDTTVSITVYNDKNYSKLIVSMDTSTEPTYQSEVAVGYNITFTLDNKYENQIGTNTYTISAEHNKDDVEKLIQDLVENNTSSYYDEDDYRERYDYLLDTVSYTASVESVLSDDNVITVTYKLDDLLNEINDEETRVEITEQSMVMRASDDVEMIDVDKENGVNVLQIEDMDGFTEIGTEILQNLENGKQNFTFAQVIYQIAMSYYNSYSNYYDYDDYDDYDDDYTYNDFSLDDEDELDIDVEDEEGDDDEDALLSLTPSTTTPSSTDKDYSEDVNADVSFAITKCLSQYRAAAAMDSSTSPNDYLTVENIENNSSLDMSISLIDGQTLECEYKGSTYTVKIDIDGEAWQLLSVKTTKD